MHLKWENGSLRKQLWRNIETYICRRQIIWLHFVFKIPCHSHRLTDDYQRVVQVEALVTERLTGRQQNATKSITLHKYDYKLEVIRGAESFKPGLPYSITVKVATQEDVPISDANPRALLVKHGFSYNHEDFNSSYHSIPSSGLVTLTFNAPTDEEKYVLGIEATYKDLTEWFPTVQKALSVTNAYLEVDINTESPRVSSCDETKSQSIKSFILITSCIPPKASNIWMLSFLILLDSKIIIIVIIIHSLSH